MLKPLLSVIAVGIAIGLMIPAADESAVPAAGTFEAHSSPTKASHASPPPRARRHHAYAEMPRETRLERRSNGHFYVTADVNGYPVEFVVDTGATSVALTEEDARRLGIAFNPYQFTVVGRGASGDVRGQPVVLDTVDIDGKRVSSVPGVVLEGLDVSLLGQSYLSRIGGVQMSGDQMALR